jgi:leucyl-tRNA synthetase
MSITLNVINMSIIMLKPPCPGYEDEYRERCCDLVTKDGSKGKYMITFPYPYMNGRLHCGHYFSLTKCEFIARQRDLEGYDVLFALGFHVTGTPIVSASKRVNEELDNGVEGKQIKILYNMGVDPKEIPKFRDPKYWGPYFIEGAKKDIAFAGVCANIGDRSFMTTEENPYYDRFVRWQFKNLHNDGYLEFGKKHIIYSPKDGQPCADHDRSTGEGVIPQAVFCVKYKIGTNTYLLISTLFPEYAMNHEEYFKIRNPEYAAKHGEYFKTRKCTKIGVSDGKFVCVSNIINGRYEKWVMSETAADNILYQVPGAKIKSVDFTRKSLGETIGIWGLTYDIVDAKNVGQTGIYFMGKDSKSALSRDGIMVSKDFKLNKIREMAFKEVVNDTMVVYYEPSNKVISRLGDSCVVALVDQWFIDYGKTRDIVMEYAQKMETYSDVTKGKLQAAIEWLDMWPCSRSEGLGTKMPCDESVLIDSLSDSTIYWCLYTFYHLLRKYPIEQVNDSLFDYVLRGDISEDYDVTPEVEEMRKEFVKWYPVDLRASAKDLIGNHLPMALHNHYMIWKDKSMLPRSYYTNGYMLFNGAKMSKSDKFVTMDDIIKEYGIDSSRIALALAGDSNEDASFETQNALDAQKLLSDELEWINEVLAIDVADSGKTEDDYIWCKFFHNQINADITYVTEKFHNMAIRDAYVRIRGMKSNKDMLRYFFKRRIDDQYVCKKVMVNYIGVFANCIHPFAPCWSYHVADLLRAHGFEFEFKWPEAGVVDHRLQCLEDIYFGTMRTIRQRFTESDKKVRGPFRYKVDVHVYDSFGSLESYIFAQFKEQLTDIADIKRVKKNIMTKCDTNEKKKVCGAFSREVEKNISQYGIEWLQWSTEMINEQYKLFDFWLMTFLSENKPIDTNGGMGEVNVIRHKDNDNDTFNGPMRPKIEISDVHVKFD